MAKEVTFAQIEKVKRLEELLLNLQSLYGVRASPSVMDQIVEVTNLLTSAKKAANIPEMKH